jgi:DNA polymerase-3 subunit gamma/tau
MNRIPLQTKYAPQSMADIVFSSPEAELFIPLIASRQHPCTHLMLYGTSGNGKTSCANIIARELTQNTHCLLSDYIGDFLARDNLKSYLSNSIFISEPEADRCVIVFHELDKHKGSLAPLWQIMDEFENELMVIFTTNNPTDFESPVLSRCDKYEFTKVTPQQFSKRAVEILNQESIKMTTQDVIHYLTTYTGALADVRDYMRVLDKIVTLERSHQLPPITNIQSTLAPNLIRKPNLKVSH